MKNRFHEKLKTFKEDLVKRGEFDGLEGIYKTICSLHLTNVNHAILQLIVARKLIREGRHVEAEVEIGGKIYDLFSQGEDTMGIEVETGFVPSEYALNPEEYLEAKFAIKIARYSLMVEKFYIAVPSYLSPPVPRELLKSPSERDDRELKLILSKVKKFNGSPDVNLKTLKKGKLDGLLTVNISNHNVSMTHLSEPDRSVKENERKE